MSVNGDHLFYYEAYVLVLNNDFSYFFKEIVKSSLDDHNVS
jgi:hypothetical protein